MYLGFIAEGDLFKRRVSDGLVVAHPNKDRFLSLFGSRTCGTKPVDELNISLWVWARRLAHAIKVCLGVIGPVLVYEGGVARDDLPDAKFGDLRIHLSVHSSGRSGSDGLRLRQIERTRDVASKPD